MWHNKRGVTCQYLGPVLLARKCIDFLAELPLFRNNCGTVDVYKNMAKTLICFQKLVVFLLLKKPFGNVDLNYSRKLLSAFAVVR